jgi:hypothetical protein
VTALADTTIDTMTSGAAGASGGILPAPLIRRALEGYRAGQGPRERARGHLTAGLIERGGGLQATGYRLQALRQAAYRYSRLRTFRNSEVLCSKLTRAFRSSSIGSDSNGLTGRPSSVIAWSERKTLESLELAHERARRS